MKRISSLATMMILLSLLVGLQVPAAGATGDLALPTATADGPGNGLPEAGQDPWTADASAGPVITIWYDSPQDFGVLGNPQRQINILGNVSGATTLQYSLNGGPFLPLDMGTAIASEGPEGGLGGDPVPLDVDELADLTAAGNKRLVSKGDFNIEVATTSLLDGQNTVVVSANGGQATKTVIVNYSAGNVWPQPYTIDWSTVTDITDVAQIVDGLWELEDDSIRPVVTGYDRLVAIGDVTWDDYEVTVPITIHEWLGDSGGVGLLARWQGHFSVGGEQPGLGWWQMGAYGFYLYRSPEKGESKLAMYTGFDDLIADSSGFQLRTNRPYYFKMRVQTKAPGLPGFYSFKVWKAQDPEPSTWTFEVQDEPPDLLYTGSTLLVAHKVDASFGEVTVLPILDVTTSTVGNGTVSVSPELVGLSDAYIYGDTITLSADPAPGWAFAGWSGDLSGHDNPATVVLADDLDVTATFAPERTLTVNVVEGSGQVELEPPGGVYGLGMTVELTPKPDPGWFFDNWGGPDAGDLVYEGNGTWSLTMDENKSLAVSFVNKVSIYLPMVLRD